MGYNELAKGIVKVILDRIKWMDSMPIVCVFSIAIFAELNYGLN